MGRGSAEVQVEDRQGTVMRLGFVLAALLASQLALAQTGGSQSAFEAGKLLGQGKNQGAFSGITGGSAQDRIPRYGMSTPEASYFAGGKGETAGPGVGKMQSCASYIPGTDKVANQECEAVNLLARNPNVRPRFNIGQNDSMVQKYKQLRDNAEQAFAQFFPGGAGSQSQCVTRNETRPGQYSTGTCVSAQEVGTQQCTMGRAINIDTDANFQCEQTINTHESLKCRRGSSVTVGFGQCTPGAWLGRVAYVDCSRCVDPYMAMNIYCGSDGRSYKVNPYRSYDGVNRYDYNWIGYPWDGSYGYFNVAVAPGQSVVDYYVSNLGFGCNLYVYYSVSCGTSTCTPSIRGVSSGCNAASGSGTGAPLQLPLTKTISNWTSDQCMALKARTQ